jgi:hypothetical protein
MRDLPQSARAQPTRAAPDPWQVAREALGLAFSIDMLKRGALALCA